MELLEIEAYGFNRIITAVLIEIEMLIVSISYPFASTQVNFSHF